MSRFQYREQQTAAQEQLEYERLRLEDSIPGEQTNQNNENQLGMFIPIQSYEGHESIAREPVTTEVSLALCDPQNRETVDASSQHVTNVQEQPSMDISPGTSVDGAGEMNQELLYENEDEDIVKDVPFEVALSAVLKKRAKLEMVKTCICVFVRL